MSTRFLLPNNTQPASKTKPGVVKIGTGLDVDNNGEVSLPNINTISSGTKYSLVELDTQGRVIAGTQPSDLTLSDYGITDAVNKTDSEIFGTATITSNTDKTDGSANKAVFRVQSNDNKSLFEVKENGDTVVGGVLTVDGTGTSTFAGDVHIGGAITVEQSATIQANFSGNNMSLTGDLSVKGNTTLGDNPSEDIAIINGVTTINTDKTRAEVNSMKADLSEGEELPDVFRIQDSESDPLFQVKGNGDTVLAGVITVNGEGDSFFAGNVNVGGNLNVDGTMTGGTQVDLSDDLTVTGKLVVEGDSQLGSTDNDGDTVDSYGVTTIHTHKAVGLFVDNEDDPRYGLGADYDSNATPNAAFLVVDKNNYELFKIKENGDTVIGGVLTVEGTGTSTFAGDVSIAGKLTVEESASVTGEMSGDNLTLTGNLNVHGNTTLGDDAANDTTEIFGFTQIHTNILKENGSNSTPVFEIVDKGIWDDTEDTWTQSPEPIFQVMENGDTVIGGIIKVKGTGESEFAGDVKIGGRLLVEEDIEGGTQMDLGEDLTVTGNLVVNGNTTLGDSADDGDTLTINSTTKFNRTVTLSGDPTDPLHAATKRYVDNAVQGLDIKDSVRVTTTKNLTTLSGLLTIDGVTVSEGDRVLVKDQTNKALNGIYVAKSDSWIRATDADNDPTGEVSPGMYTYVEQGTKHGASGWVLDVEGVIDLGTTELTFTQFSGAGQIIDGRGITKSGNELEVDIAGKGDFGGVKIGDGINVESDGTISVTAAGTGGVSLTDVDTDDTGDTIVQRTSDGSIRANNISLSGNITRVNGKNTTGNFGVNTVTANASNVSVGTSFQNIVNFTPKTWGNHLVYIYFKVTTATSVDIELTYNDGTSQTQTIVTGNQPIGSYSVSPVFINVADENAITVKAKAGTNDALNVSANITSL